MDDFRIYLLEQKRLDCETPLIAVKRLLVNTDKIGPIQ